MFTIQELVQPDSLDEAFKILAQKKNNTILGGCAFLKMGSKRIGTAIDLSHLGLGYIVEQDSFIQIGAMTSLRDIEMNSLLKESFNGILPKSVRNIIGVQFRNGVTVGGSVYAKYGFSDLITALLGLDTEVELYNNGRMPLADFLDSSCEKDLLVKLWIKKNKRLASYQSFRNSASDYPILNVAVSELDDRWTIAVGARPRRAAIAKSASAALFNENLTDREIGHAAQMVTKELSFGTNTRGTADYRRALCQVLVKRGIGEVLQCKSR